MALAFPGAGHVLLGRTGKGATLGACLCALFLLGLAMHARLAPWPSVDDPLAFVRIGAQLAIGLPYLLARGAGVGLGEIPAAAHEYGNTFTEVAGLLNLLVVLDTYDTALGRRA